MSLDKITDVCTTPEDFIKSEDFMKWLNLILEKTRVYNKEYVLSIFEKLNKWENLNDEEKKDLTSFLLDHNVIESGENILWIIKKFEISSKFSNFDELRDCSKLLGDIFWPNWFRKIQSYIWRVAKITDLILDKYEWMEEIKIKEDWEIKKIYRDEELLKLDSSDWEEKLIKEINNKKEQRVKMNNEKDIIGYLEWQLEWKQLLTLEAARREAEKLWKRLPTFSEFKAMFEQNREEFMNFYPGFLNTKDSYFWQIGKSIYFWLDEDEDEDEDGNKRNAICIEKDFNEDLGNWKFINWDYWLSVILVND